MADLPGPTLLGIAAVERDTGIGKDTLRVWERRYGFPAPLRDATGERVYPVEQVQRLRLLKRLLDAGHRPGRVVPLQSGLAEPSPGALAQLLPLAPELTRILDLLRSHDVEGLRRALSQALLRMGLGPFVLELIAPLTTQVGVFWMRGELEVFEEHIYTESLQQVLRHALQATPPLDVAERPRVLLTTLPGEQHGLGLLMAEALLTLEGCQCLSLGVQTPQEELARAAAAHRADIVALSFSGFLPVGVVQRGLASVRLSLPPSTELWAGGGGAELRPRSQKLAGLYCVSALTDVAAQVARWRRAQASRVNVIVQA
ncbi:HTH-type transcriptional repressor CarH [soil metagenome]